MGHLHHHKAYQDLQARLDQMPASFPATKEGLALLRLLFTDEEAAVVAQMPFRPQSAEKIAKRLQKPVAQVTKMLDHLADKGLIFDLYNEAKDRSYYCLAPPIVGFIEFSLMRVRGDLDQPALAAAYEEYFHSPNNLAYQLFNGSTVVGRTLVHEEAVSAENLAELFPYERAKQVVESASAWAVCMCYCRHKAEHLGKRCAAPMENCLTLNGAVSVLSRHQHVRPIEKKQALEIVEQSKIHSLVFIADNVQNEVGYLCSCCACCCGQIAALNQLGLNNAVKTSSLIANIDKTLCNGCGRCLRRCPVHAISLEKRLAASDEKNNLFAVVDKERCLGCGVCHQACRKENALLLKKREARILTPAGTLERILLMALERDKLQHLLFDQQDGLHMLALNRLWGAILRMPPVKRALLSEKLRSRFIEFCTR